MWWVLKPSRRCSTEHELFWKHTRSDVESVLGKTILGWGISAVWLFEKCFKNHICPFFFKNVCGVNIFFYTTNNWQISQWLKMCLESSIQLLFKAFWWTSGISTLTDNHKTQRASHYWTHRKDLVKQCSYTNSWSFNRFKHLWHPRPRPCCLSYVWFGWGGG